MVTGVVVRSFNGREGKITVPGLGAVVATFSSWSLRREEDDSAGPSWSLHAVLSYKNLTFMQNEAIAKRFILTMSKDTKIELCAYRKFHLEGDSLLVEGATRCQ